MYGVKVEHIRCDNAGDDEPRNFQEAWYDQNKEKRQKWRVAICKEFKDIIRRGVWDIVERSSIPEGR